jgi:hypothetical protein
MGWYSSQCVPVTQSCAGEPGEVGLDVGQLGYLD